MVVELRTIPAMHAHWRLSYDATMKPDKQTVNFTGRIISVTTDEVLLPNGHRALLEVVHHPGGAAVAALDDSQRICLLRQYRYVADGWLWELPAGKLEPDEPPLATAQRELTEEAGVAARTLDRLGRSGAESRTARAPSGCCAPTRPSDERAEIPGFP